MISSHWRLEKCKRSKLWTWIIHELPNSRTFFSEFQNFTSDSPPLASVTMTNCVWKSICDSPLSSYREEGIGTCNNYSSVYLLQPKEKKKNIRRRRKPKSGIFFPKYYWLFWQKNLITWMPNLLRQEGQQNTAWFQY